MNRRRLIFAFVAVQDFVVGLLARNLDTHRALLAPGIERGRCMVGGWRAWRTFELARRRVPAYRDYLDAVAPGAQVRLDGWTPDFGAIPEMDKDSYIRRYGIEQR
nr:CoF synthetase [Solirubrobacterales bacterium]